jgi:hypothetical protein
LLEFWNLFTWGILYGQVREISFDPLSELDFFWVVLCEDFDGGSCFTSTSGIRQLSSVK